MMQEHVLVVDDEASESACLSEGLSRAGFLVTTANDAAEAFTLLVDGVEAPAPVDLLLTDYNMPRLTGLELVDVLRREGLEMPILLMSGDLSGTLAMEALSRGCTGFIKKPFSVQVLVEHIRVALEVRSNWGAMWRFGT
ncbi:MAG: response regulator [Candidatus Hydrogenedentota bacterium]